MAWNQPGEEKKRPPPRGAPETNSLDELRRRLQRQVQQLWRPGSSRRTLLVAALVVVALWLASGYYQIGPSERGVVQRFGRFVAVEQPGHIWRWPRPIETVNKLDVANPGGVDSNALMVSSDQSLVEVSWSVQYRISDPLRYLFHVREPQESLRQASETVVRELVAVNSIATLLDGEARARISTEARERIQKALDGYGAGMELTAVNLTDPQLPDPVRGAQRDASKAAEDRQRVISEAETYTNEVVPAAQSAAQHLINDADVYATQTRATADGEAQRFTEVAQSYARAPEVTRNRMYIETMETILSRAHKIIIDAKSGSGNVIYIPLDKLADAMRNSSSTAPAAAPAPAAAAPAAVSTPSPASVGAGDDAHSRDRPER
jgi:modulator of FtsH protease HflK